MTGCENLRVGPSPGNVIDVGRASKREVGRTLEFAPREGVANLPDPDGEREEDGVARGAEIGALLDDEGRREVADVQAEAEGVGAGRNEAGGRLEGLAQGRRGHGGEAQVPVRRGAHLEAHLDADRRVPRERARSLEELHDDRDGQLGARHGQGGAVDPERGKELVQVDSGAGDQLAEVQGVHRRQRERFAVIRHAGPN